MSEDPCRKKREAADAAAREMELTRGAGSPPPRNEPYDPEKHITRLTAEAFSEMMDANERHEEAIRKWHEALKEWDDCLRGNC